MPGSQRRAAEQGFCDTTETPEAQCLSCACKFDAATGEGALHPGALSVCIRCGAVAMFDDDLRVRPLTGAEEEAVRGDEATMRLLGRVVRAIHFVRAQRN